MLIEIQCDRFREKSVRFSEGLNVVVGDDNATNSIGKSTLLMIIDFAFGGTTLIDHNQDVIDELGDQFYRFQFRDDEGDCFYRRGTYSPDIVDVCDSNYESIETIKVDKYTSILKDKFGPTGKYITFRAAVGLCARVWGKKNLDVDEPLHVYPKMKSSVAVDNLLKLYDRFDTIAENTGKLRDAKGQQSALRDDFKHKIVPKITRTTYKANLEKIDESRSELDEIKSELEKFAYNLSEIANKEIMELKELKDELLKAQFLVSEKLARVARNIDSKSYIRSRSMEPLKHFFPDVDEQRLLGIEEFHSEISKILKEELRESRKELKAELNEIDDRLSEIDGSIIAAFSSIDKPDVIVDRVYNVSRNLEQATSENEYYDQKLDNDAKTKVLAQSLKEVKSTELAAVEGTINTRIQEIVSDVYDEHRKSPVLSLGDTNYQFAVFEDTGTGKAYSNLLILDLAIFDTCSLPFLVHDTPLFKNIENDTVARLLGQYAAKEKQSFISLDEIGKYGSDAETLIMNNCVIKLSDDSVLFDKDWRDTST